MRAVRPRLKLPPEETRGPSLQPSREPREVPRYEQDADDDEQPPLMRMIQGKKRRNRWNHSRNDSTATAAKRNGTASPAE